MSKIICDVCGTAFAENAAQCPICGSAKRKNPMTVNGNNTNTEESGYKAVKGGRFSKKNVRKRNQDMARQNQPDPSNNNQEDNKGNKGLMILMFVLIGAVVAVFLYIVLRLAGPMFQPTDPTQDPTTTPITQPTTDPVTDPTTEPTSAPSTDPTEATVPCEGLILHEPRVELENLGQTAVINVTISPADTTDTLTFISSNEDVVTVDQKGTVTAVGSGEAKITVACGLFHVDCVVVVHAAEEPTTEPTTEPTEPSTEPPKTIVLNREDITFAKEGESWNLYDGNLPLTQIQWSTDDETIATISNGVVKAVGPGVTKVYGEYEGVKVSCIIRCRWNAPETQPTEPTLDPNETYSISHKDVSIKVGESFRLVLRDSDGKAVNVKWKVSKDGYVDIDGNKITGVKSINDQNFTVYVTVGEKTYSCVVRVK